MPSSPLSATSANTDAPRGADATHQLKRMGLAFGQAFSSLVMGTGLAWIQLWPRLVALTLLGWSAYYGSVLLAAQLALVSAWLVIAALAAGVVARLAALVVALRVVAKHLGAPELMRQVIPEQVVDDRRDQRLSRLLSLTLLPFLGVYAAFGYVNSFAQDVVVLSSLSQGPADLLRSLNPVESPLTTWIVILAAAALYLARRVLDQVFDRTGNAVIGFAAVLGEATLLLLIALSGFRVIQTFWLWLGDREIALWWESLKDLITGWLHFDLPAVIEAVFAFVSDVFWPVFWEVITEPIAWLALTSLVFGSRVIALSDLWQPRPATSTGSQRLERARLQMAKATGVQRVTQHLQEAFFGDLTDKYLPAWLALKLVLRAGWLFLGAYVLAFNLLRLGGEWIQTEVHYLLGGSSYVEWMKIQPFLNLITDVVTMSAQFALLGVTFTQILNHIAGDQPGPGPGHRRYLARFGQVVAVGLLLTGFTAISLLQPNQSEAVRQVAVGQESRLDAQRVRVDTVSYGDTLIVDSRPPVRTSLVFVVVRVGLFQPDADLDAVRVSLVNKARTYRPGSWLATSLYSAPGFRTTANLAFEVDPADLNESLSVRIKSAALFTSFNDVVSVNLGLTDEAKSRIVGRTLACAAGTTKEVP